MLLRLRAKTTLFLGSFSAPSWTLSEGLPAQVKMRALVVSPMEVRVCLPGRQSSQVDNFATARKEEAGWLADWLPSLLADWSAGWQARWLASSFSRRLASAMAANRTDNSQARLACQVRSSPSESERADPAGFVASSAGWTDGQTCVWPPANPAGERVASRFAWGKTMRRLSGPDEPGRPLCHRRLSA